MALKTDQVRPHVSQAFYNYASDVARAPLWKLMTAVENSWNLGRPTVIGYVPGRNGSMLSAGAKRHPGIFGLIKHAARDLDIDADGAMVATGVARLPVVHPRSTVGLLVSWPRNQHSQVTYRDMRPYWGTNLENHLGHDDPENFCHIFSYSWCLWFRSCSLTHCFRW